MDSPSHTREYFIPASSASYINSVRVSFTRSAKSLKSNALEIVELSTGTADLESKLCRGVALQIGFSNRKMMRALGTQN